MPEGIIATDDGEGFTTLDFVDKSLRGPALAQLIEIGGPATVETISRRGPRRMYRVPTGNAVEAGLVDSETARGVNADGTPSDSGPGGGTGTTETHRTSAGADTGFAAKLVAADPNVNPGADNANWHTPVAEYTSANKYVGTVPNDDVLHDRAQVYTGDADSFGGLAVAPTHREVIDHVKESSSVLAVGGVLPATEPFRSPAEPAALRNLALKEQTGALGSDPGAWGDVGGQSIAEDYTSVQSSRDGQGVKSDDELGGTTVTVVPGTVQAVTEPTDPTVVEGTNGPSDAAFAAGTDTAADQATTPPDNEDVIEYPQGAPSKDWRRDELNAYALKVKQLDTSSLGNKDDVLAAINAINK